MLRGALVLLMELLRLGVGGTLCGQVTERRNTVWHSFAVRRAQTTVVCISTSGVTRKTVSRRKTSQRCTSCCGVSHSVA